MPKIFIEDLT